MCDYKFRGKTKNGEWIYGSLVVTTHGLKTHTKTWIVQSAFGNGGWFNILQRQYVLPETVGQFTGLLDKNGVEIYEGDILKITHDENEDGYVTKAGSALNAFKVDVELCEYDFTSICWVYDAMCDVELEVIGNIYENPELLESK